MRCALLLLLVLAASCSKGAEVESKLAYETLEPPSPDRKPPRPERADPADAPPKRTLHRNTSPQLDKTQTPTAEATCYTDSKGVVRIDHPNGKKEVYRDDCQNNVLVHYTCVEGTVRDTGEVCPYGCQQGAYGDSCRPGA